MKTAVEWYNESLKNLIKESELTDMRPSEFDSKEMMLIEQAKKMEKEQMCKFAYKCHNHYKVYGDFKIDQYYNETFITE